MSLNSEKREGPLLAQSCLSMSGTLLLHNRQFCAKSGRSAVCFIIKQRSVDIKVNVSSYTSSVRS